MPDPAAVKSMFGRIANRYDITNRLLSAGVDRGWRRKLVAEVRAGNPSRILDLATGSGDVAFALARGVGNGAEITGMDFCQPMLDQAEIKRRSGGFDRITFRQGDALALPVDEACFDALTIAFGLRNLADRAKGLQEMHRVLRAGGRLYVLEFSQPYRWFRPIYYFYLRRILPKIAGLTTGDRAAYEYLNNTISEFPDRAALVAEIQAAGFFNVRAIPMTFGIVALHIGEKLR
jgi:demethylmenaquinone methyltransferase/2-methoxy-6-polyprenyl-1,4-benzoquinol methylase